MPKYAQNDPLEYEMDVHRRPFPKYGPWQQIGLHTTGGIRDHNGVLSTMKARNVAVHFVCDPDGSFVQVLNLGLRGAHITGLSDIAVGIEFVSPLYAGKLASQESLKGVVRSRYAAKINGHHTGFVGLTNEQMESALHFVPKLCADLGIPMKLPENPDGSLRTARFASKAEARAHHGVLCHFHWHANKQDPGLDLPTALHNLQKMAT